MAQAKTPTVRKPKFEAKQTQRTKPIGKPTRKEFASPTITEAALDRRRLLSSAPLLTLLGAVSFPLAEGAAAESQASETHLAEVPLASGVTLTVERSGQVALFGINRPQIQNRLDPTTFRALATAYYDYDHDPSLRAAVLFGHGEHFSRGIDIDAFKPLLAAQQPWIPAQGTIDPLAKRRPFLSKPLVVAVHGDTWNMADELFLVADIRSRCGQRQLRPGREHPWPLSGRRLDDPLCAGSRLGQRDALHPDRRSLDRRGSLSDGNRPRSAAHTRCSTPTGDRAGPQDRRLWSTRHQDVFGLRPPRCGPGGGGGAGPARGAVRRPFSHPRFSGGS